MILKIQGKINVTLPWKLNDTHNISSSDDSIDWKLYEIFVNKKIYEVFACDIDSQIYIKPFKKYENSEFEQLFDFGFNCRKYDENKIVWVKNSKLINY